MALNFWEEGGNEQTSGSLLGVSQGRQTSKCPMESPCPQKSGESGLCPFHTQKGGGHSHMLVASPPALESHSCGFDFWTEDLPTAPCMLCPSQVKLLIPTGENKATLYPVLQVSEAFGFQREAEESCKQSATFQSGHRCSVHRTLCPRFTEPHYNSARRPSLTMPATRSRPGESKEPAQGLPLQSRSANEH